MSIKGFSRYFITPEGVVDSKTSKLMKVGSRGKFKLKDDSGSFRQVARSVLFEETPRDLYEKSPKLCKCCGVKIPYSSRSNDYCSSSCSAKVNNIGVVRNGVKRNVEDTATLIKPSVQCKCCGLIVVGKPNAIFCSPECSSENRRNDTIRKWIDSGENVGVRTMKRYLIETHGHRCSCCGNSEWNGKPIPIELEHIDGNSENNEIQNLTLLCPNCHAQTETYKGRNRGNGRAYRRERYAAGKSF